MGTDIETVRPTLAGLPRSRTPLRSGSGNRIRDLYAVSNPVRVRYLNRLDTLCQNATRTIGREYVLLHPRLQTIGRYQVISEIGHGGQATIYRAWDPQLSRDVAIKVSHLRVDPVAFSVTRIAQEAAVLSQIRHPGLVHLYDVGVEDDHPFLVMEYVAGRTLKDAFSRSRPPMRQVRDMMLQISDALEIAHRAGVLHLDLKPENVLITQDGRCKLIDFGMSWSLAEKQGPQLVFAAGTPEYMAPEQCAGRTSEWTVATDVYGLGGILHFLMTGSPPSPNPSRGARVNESSIAIPTDRRSRVKSLSAILKIALAEEASHRFRSSKEFRDAIDNRASLLAFRNCRWGIVICILQFILVLTEPAQVVETDLLHSNREVLPQMLVEEEGATFTDSLEFIQPLHDGIDGEMIRCFHVSDKLEVSPEIDAEE